MKDIKRLFLEIKIEIFKIIILNAFLRSVIFLLILYLPIAIFGIKKHMSIIRPVLVILSAIFFVAHMTIQFKRIRYELLEKREPELQDILTTAHDTMDSENVMVRAMWRDLAVKLRKVRPVMFFEPDKILKWVVTIFVLATVITLAPTGRFELAKHNVTAEYFNWDLKLPGFDDDYEGSDIDSVDIVNDESIFGDKSVIILGDEELTFEIAQDFSGIDFSEEGDGLDSESADDELSEVFIPQGATFDAKKAALNRDDQKQWIKNYFNTIEN